MFSSVQLLSCVQLCDAMDCTLPGPPVHHQLLELAQTHVHRVDDAIQLECHLIISSSVVPFSSCLQSFPASGSFPMSRFFTSGGQSIYWSFSISPSNQYSGLISFRNDWFDFPAVQGIHKSLLLHHNSKASVLRHLAFFMVQASYPYMTTGKTIALIMWTSVSKVVSRHSFSSKEQASFHSMAAPKVILESKVRRICHCSHVSLFCPPWSGRTRCHDLSFLTVYTVLKSIMRAQSRK